MAIGAGTSNQVLTSQGSSAPIWATAPVPAGTLTNAAAFQPATTILSNITHAPLTNHFPTSVWLDGGLTVNTGASLNGQTYAQGILINNGTTNPLLQFPYFSGLTEQETGANLGEMTVTGIGGLLLTGNGNGVTNEDNLDVTGLLTVDGVPVLTAAQGTNITNSLLAASNSLAAQIRTLGTNDTNAIAGVSNLLIAGQGALGTNLTNSLVAASNALILQTRQLGTNITNDLAALSNSIPPPQTNAISNVVSATPATLTVSTNGNSLALSTSTNLLTNNETAVVTFDNTVFVRNWLELFTLPGGATSLILDGDGNGFTDEQGSDDPTLNSVGDITLSAGGNIHLTTAANSVIVDNGTTLVGSGAGLTHLQATNLIGTIAGSNLPGALLTNGEVSNIAFAQSFTASNNVTGGQGLYAGNTANNSILSNGILSAANGAFIVASNGQITDTLGASLTAAGVLQARGFSETNGNFSVDTNGNITAAGVISGAHAGNAAGLTNYAKASSTNFGVVEPDGGTLTSTGGILSVSELSFGASGSTYTPPYTNTVIIGGQGNGFAASGGATLSNDVVLGGQTNGFGNGAVNSVILGGVGNLITGFANGDVILGGASNGISATATNSVTGGRQSQMVHKNAFLWSDGHTGLQSSAGDNTFSIWSQGGLWLNGTNINPNLVLSVAVTNTTGATPGLAAAVAGSQLNLVMTNLNPAAFQPATTILSNITSPPLTNAAAFQPASSILSNITHAPLTNAAAFQPATTILSNITSPPLTNGNAFIASSAGVGTNVTLNGSSLGGTNIVTGELTFPQPAYTVVNNGINMAVSPGTNVSIDLGGPSAAFSITGFTGGRDGRILILRYAGGQWFTLVNQSGADIATNIVNTGTGANLVFSNGLDLVVLKYSGLSQQWELLSQTGIPPTLNEAVTNIFTNGSPVVASHLYGSASAFAGYVTNGQCNIDTGGNIGCYLGQASDLAAVISLTNIGWANWATDSTGGSILFTNFYSVPFATEPIVIVNPADNSFADDYYTANNFTTLAWCNYGLSTTSYCVIQSNGLMPPIGYASGLAWNFQLMIIGTQ